MYVTFSSVTKGYLELIQIYRFTTFYSLTIYRGCSFEEYLVLTILVVCGRFCIIWMFILFCLWLDLFNYWIFHLWIFLFLNRSFVRILDSFTLLYCALSHSNNDLLSFNSCYITWRARSIFQYTSRAAIEADRRQQSFESLPLNYQRLPFLVIFEWLSKVRAISNVY